MTNGDCLTHHINFSACNLCQIKEITSIMNQYKQIGFMYFYLMESRTIFIFLILTFNIQTIILNKQTPTQILFIEKQLMPFKLSVNRNLQSITIAANNNQNVNQFSRPNYLPDSNLKGDYFSSFIPTSLNGYTASSFSNQVLSTQSSTPQTTTPVVQTESIAASISYQKIQNTQFPNIVLYHNVPTQFLLGQIFTFQGRTTSPQSVVNIIFSPQSSGNKIQITYNLNFISQFTIPVQMTASGTFYLSIFIGMSGTSTRTTYNIRNAISSQNLNQTPPPTPVSVNLAQANNNLVLNWTSAGNSLYPISKIRFTQPGTQLVFILSNFANSFQVPFIKFWNFAQNQSTVVQISQAKSNTPSSVGRVSQFSNPKAYTFKALQHMFSQISPSISVNNILFTTSPNVPYIISGSASVKLKNEVLVLTPNKAFVSYFLNSQLGPNDIINIGSYFSISIATSFPGIYIVQINSNLGEAVFNSPIYVGTNSYPLIPDFIDLNSIKSLSPSQIAASQPSNLVNQQNLLLNLINSKRSQFDVDPIYEDSILDNLAQLHSNDMAKRNYVGHYTPEGLSPTDRAVQLGIYEQIGQNIGVNSNITDAHHRLARSNIHLRNMVSADWVRVGLGIALNPQNSFLISQEYAISDLSKFPLSDQEKIMIKSLVFNYIIANSGSIRSQNTTLSSQVSKWHQTHLTGKVQDLVNYIGGFGYSRYYGSSQIVSYGSNSADLIIAQNNLFPNNNLYTQVGASVLYNKGNIEMYLVFIS